MARHGYYDEKYGFFPYDDCPQDNLYSESEAKHTFSPSKPMTNADRIRAMTDEELAELFWIRADCELCPNKEPYCSDDCKKHWLKWLEQEIEQ